MKLSYKKSKHHTIKSENTTFSFLSTGDAFEFTSNNVLINQLRGTAKDGSINNIWLRIYKENGLSVYPLLGKESQSTMLMGKHSVRFLGNVENISYEINFVLSNENTWFWVVSLNGQGETADLVYGQDIGVADKNGVLTNELYIAQYLGHSTFKDEKGYHVCSRQNQSQGGNYPYLQQGVIDGKSIGYSTDGMQFFGLSYKSTQFPEALNGELANENLQGEFSYTALQTEKLSLHEPKQVAFYGHIQKNYPTAITKLENVDKIEALFHQIILEDTVTKVDNIRQKDIFAGTYCSPTLPEKEIESMYDSMKLVEKENGKLLSFFTDTHSHVVTQEKELLVERPHGTIISTFIDTEKINNNLITSTNYMYGMFNGQTVVGNTSYNKFLSASRGLLNCVKNSGQRIYIKLEEKYHLLTIPAIYEMGMNYSRWYYVLPNQDILLVSSFAVNNSTDIALQVESKLGNKYDYIITNQLVLGEQEYSNDIAVEELENGSIVRFMQGKENQITSPYPNLSYDIQLPDTHFTWSDDRIFFEDNSPQDETLMTISILESSSFQMIISGHLKEAPVKSLKKYSFQKEKEEYLDLYRNFIGGFALRLPKEQETKEIEKLNETVWWYTHNALVHFAVPHGLEQPGGAAWGTRDVCQGPMEIFLATQNHKLARATLLEIFAHQEWQSGEWPQWFMFDKYTANAGECHGDVVFWPLKAVSDYLMVTGDYSCLKETIGYKEANGHDFKEKGTLLSHIKRSFETIRKRFIGASYLITYAGGDWNDTLQPANAEMRENLISTWTQALAYQSLHQLGNTLKSIDSVFADELLNVATKIGEAFNKFLIDDNVITGFVEKTGENSYKPLLHPKDTTTGIHYRLLPMTRSIIGELVDKKQASNSLEIIKKHLLCPDGARLMDMPPKYNGGTSKLFLRAEQATNVGREVSLMYTHAHIRYMEAMAKLGFSDLAWNALFQVNPILIKDSVSNANLRQSNLYFSSSEGAYKDRYDFSENFDKLKTGNIPVKGGWRLYSSGPGIYLNQLITNILGISLTGNSLLINPALPAELNGLSLSFTAFNQKINFTYDISEERNATSVKILGKNTGTPVSTSIYGSSGVLLSKEEVVASGGEIHIFC